ncbi:MAG: hypothetical protein L6V90_10935 [Treponema succinifaciens]|nr:MAG: hypothetical protein L6V90_10935 [Treponema succinifaciens]
MISVFFPLRIEPNLSEQAELHLQHFFNKFFSSILLRLNPQKNFYLIHSDIFIEEKDFSIDFDSWLKDLKGERAKTNV